MSPIPAKGVGVLFRFPGVVYRRWFLRVVVFFLYNRFFGLYVGNIVVDEHFRVASRPWYGQGVQSFRRYRFRLRDVVRAVDVIRWGIFFHRAVLTGLCRFRPRAFLRRPMFFVCPGRRQFAIFRVGNVL